MPNCMYCYAECKTTQDLHSNGSHAKCWNQWDTRRREGLCVACGDVKIHHTGGRRLCSSCDQPIVVFKGFISPP